MRINGEITPIPYEALTREVSEMLLFEIMDGPTRARYEAHKDVDFSYSIRGENGRFRVATVEVALGVRAVVQARGFANAPCAPEALDVVERWAAENHLSVRLRGA